MAKAPPLYSITPEGKLRLNFHPGQWKAWHSVARTILLLTGIQAGKTEFGVLWMAKEIQKCGPGDYLIATPTYPLMGRKLHPFFLKIFSSKRGLNLGKLTGKDNHFEFSQEGLIKWFGRSDEPCRIFFGHGDDPDSLESATCKAAWLDEVGQHAFKLGSYEAVMGRLAISRGQLLLTTIPYELGWLKQQVYDRWRNGDHEIEVINFESIMNPAFSLEEWERQKNTLPPWKFNMRYRGLFERPAGVIYDCFDSEKHVCPDFVLDGTWPRYLGMDFGGLHTAGVFLAEERTPDLDPTGRYFLYREYPERGRWKACSIAQHTKDLMTNERSVPFAVGGSHSEDQWRTEFRMGGEINGVKIPGLPIREPTIKEVEVGIERVYAAIKEGNLMIFKSCAGVLDELATYSRKLDENGEPTEAIQDKEDFHRLDALRYILSYLKGPRQKAWVYQ